MSQKQRQTAKAVGSMATLCCQKRSRAPMWREIHLKPVGKTVTRGHCVCHWSRWASRFPPSLEHDAGRHLSFHFLVEQFPVPPETQATPLRLCSISSSSRSWLASCFDSRSGEPGRATGTNSVQAISPCLLLFWSWQTTCGMFCKTPASGRLARGLDQANTLGTAMYGNHCSNTRRENVPARRTASTAVCARRTERWRESAQRTRRRLLVCQQ